MATYSGALFIDGLLAPWGQQAEGLPLTESADPRDARGAIDHKPGTAGAFDGQQPVARLTRSFGGAVGFSYADDFYNRIWLIPQSFDFGSINADSFKQFSIWNAFFEPSALNYIAQLSGSGLSVTGIAAGQTYAPLRYRNGTLKVSGDGDPDVNGHLAFAFTVGGTVDMYVTGTRIRYWGFAPNWADGVDVELSYRTEIITSRSGREQRIAARQTPRRTISYSTLVHAANFRDFIGLMNSSMNKALMLPDFTRAGYLAMDMAVGDSDVRFDPVPTWFVEGQDFLFYTQTASGQVSERGSIETIDGGVGAMTTALTMAWPKGTKVFPLVRGRLATTLQTTQHSSNTSSVKVVFNVDPGSDPVYPSSGGSFFYDNREVFLKRPNWAGALSPEFRAVLEQVDYGYGRVHNFRPVEFNDRYHKATYVGRNRVESDEIVRFFVRQMGQQGEFFMPTWTDDLVARGGFTAETSTLRVVGPAAAVDFADLRVFRDLIVFLSDGTRIIRRVQTITTVSDALGGDSVIMLTEQWPRTVTGAEIVKICWLPLWRLASDAMTLSFRTDEVSEVSLSMKSLEYLDDGAIVLLGTVDGIEYPLEGTIEGVDYSLTTES